MITNLGAASGILAAASTDNWYSVKVNSPQTLNLDLQTTFGSPSITLVDSSGTRVASSNAASRASDGWIDATLAAGTYFIDVNSGGDAGYTLTASTGTPATGSADVDTAGQTLATARPLGTLGAAPVSIPEAIGGSDPFDYYSFNVPAATQARATVSGLSDNAAFYLLNAKGETIAQGNGSPTSSVTLNQALAPLASGTYYLEVADSNTSKSTGYSLDISASPVLTIAGDAPSSAYALGTLGATAAQHTDRLTPLAEIGYYSFSVGGPSAVSVSVSGLTDNATVYVRDGSGAVVASAPGTNFSGSGGYGNGTVVLNAKLAPLASGNYFVSVEGDNPATATPYTISATATAIPIAGGSTAAQATNLGTVTDANVVISDFVGGVNPVNAYSFTLANAATLNLDISTYSKDVLTGPVNYEITDANQKVVIIQAGSSAPVLQSSGDGFDNVFLTLPAGTYYTYITKSPNVTSTNYSLTLTTAQVLPGVVGNKGPLDGGANIASALNLGTLSAAGSPTPGWINPSNPEAWYKVTVGTPGILQLNVAGAAKGTTLILTDAGGNPLRSFSSDSATTAHLWGKYAPGDYYLKVTNDAAASRTAPNGVGTGYVLTAAEQPITDSAGPSTATARALGALSPTAQTVSDYAGPLFPDGYYKFAVTSTSAVSLNLGGLYNGVTLYLLDASGNQVASDNGSAIRNGAVQRVLAAGTYFARVSSSNDNDFTLSLSATPLANQASTSRASAAALASTPAAANGPIQAYVAANMPATSYGAAAGGTVVAALQALPGVGAVVTSTSDAGPFAVATGGNLNIAVATAPTVGMAIALPAGYAPLQAQSTGAATLSDAGAGGAVLIGAAGPTMFNSRGASVTLVGGNGANRFNVAGTATVATGDGASTVVATGTGTANVTTGTGGSTVVLAGGGGSVRSGGADTVFGGTGAVSITAATVSGAKGLTAIGGDAKLTFLGGAGTSVVFGGKGGVDYAPGAAYDIVVGGAGAVNGQTGAAGGQLWGNSGSDMLRAGGAASSVVVASKGGQLISTGSGGNFLVAGAGNTVLDGSKASGNDVFFGGGAGTQSNILLGSGNDLVATGTGTSTVQLGSGRSTVFAFGTSTITAGTGGADLVLGGSVTFGLAQGAARNFALYNFVPGTSKISLSGYGANAVASTVAGQVNGGGQTVLTLSDSTKLQLIGVTKVDSSFFG